MVVRQQATRDPRLVFIDRACGFAICLVVYAHILFKETLEMGWYKWSETFIYKFHMPLFVCLSGFLAFLSAKNAQINSPKGYWLFQRKKLLKFLPVYVLFSVYAIVVDIFLNDVSRQEVYSSVFSSFFSPTTGSAVFLWYLYILMGFYLITPFLIHLSGGARFILLAASFLLTNISLTPLFCFDFFCKFFFFFLVGGLIHTYSSEFFKFIDANGKWITLLTIAITIVDFFANLSIPFQVISLLMIPSVLYISRRNWMEPISKIFVTIGISSFAIYLLNTSLINLYYILWKSLFKVGIDAVFIFGCLIFTLLLAMLIRAVFNRVVPRKVYVL